MSNTYNIYKVQHTKIDALTKKLEQVGLSRQKTLRSGAYELTFYFSEQVEGNEIWWWKTYRNFFNDGTAEPKNIFNFGLLLCCHATDPEVIYAVSLGKSHFYLSKFVEPDFGIALAVRMADENTILLKKSRYFAGTKRQDVSSYESFQKNSYEPGESVDHLKVKASDTKVWGGKNIIFADSIQMEVDKRPEDMVQIFDLIETSIVAKEIIQLPKLEKVEGDLIGELDKVLLKALKDDKGKIKIDEFRVYGVAICFTFHNYEYRLSAKIKGEAQTYKADIGNEIDIVAIRQFLKDFPKIADVGVIRLQFKAGEVGAFTKPLKEVLDMPVDYGGFHYFLRNGDWYKFNQTFVEYLKRSLEDIELVVGVDLVEADYTAWRKQKEQSIASGTIVDDKLLYRESYFNKKLCKDYGYELLDRKLTRFHSMNKGHKKYQVEVADLYMDGEIISVKISEASHELIYNIEQSRDAVELVKRGAITFKSPLKVAALWFVFEERIAKVTEVNSIQFLLAVEAWRKSVISLGLHPKIYVSKHILK